MRKKSVAGDEGSGLRARGKDGEHLSRKVPDFQMEHERRREGGAQKKSDGQNMLKRYSDLYDVPPVGYMILTADGCIIQSNLAASKMLGVDRYELKGDRLERFVVHEDLPAFNALLKKTIRSSKRQNAKVRILTVSDEFSSPLTLHIDAFMTDDGQECRLTLTDITRHKKRERDREAAEIKNEELTGKKSYHRDIIEFMQSGYVYGQMIFENRKGVDFVYEEVNEAFETITGLKNVVGKRASEILQGFAERNPEFIEKHAQVVLSGNSDRMEVYLARLDKWLDITIYCLDNEHFVDIINDITATKLSVDTLRRSEELFRTMFEGHSICKLISDPGTGYIIESNRAAREFYGLSSDELRKIKIHELNILPNEIPASEKEQLNVSGKNCTYGRHRRADGSIRDVEILSSTILISGRVVHYSIILDITEQRHKDAVMAFRLDLNKIAEKSTVDELLQAAIDEAERQTQSNCGFFHFVSGDQKTLTLQEWSTNTKNNMCKADVQHRHYDVNEAGIWADALRERKAVIHNDYASVKDRKGMPEGHTKVVREVVVPVIRHGKVCAIIGVGNKPLEYDEEDVQWIDMIIDAAWEVIEKKISANTGNIPHFYNALEENLGIHDALTGLPKFKIFSKRLTFAIAQSVRNKSMGALIIFDLDRFKIINDTRGHDIGDLVLKKVGLRVQGVLKRSGGWISRHGGVEFVILLPEINGVSDAVELTEKIRNEIILPFDIKGQTVNVSCSFGIAVFPDNGIDELVLLKHAGDAMCRSKNEGRNRINVYCE